ncbi:sensor histidine kinase [Spirosoma utsteinense]|uniref:histidine kinase n=1 Tax=Spirosoma utsteinense TaxID=2585773 RepID=A0ABR6W3X9_9BACT|nr:hybrid sensor histidine kinase/response regulator [Spirosoma utsteinense]MBC3791296.1 signal transduction histidine kinase [Spirosoma utsteinense]
MPILDSYNEFTILLVDDRPENLISLEEMLEKEGRVFIKATSGNEALRHVLKNDRIGLIMLDVQMPGMDGFEVAKILKSNPRTNDISIIFVTALSKEEQYVRKGFEEGAVDYLQKPLDISVTRAKVNVFERLFSHQRDLKRTANQLETINKQLEKFVYVVAHDLKSPLTGLIAALSILEMNNEDNDTSAEANEYAGYAKSAAYHMSDMINDLLDYSRKSMAEQTIEDVNVLELLNQMAHLLFLPRHIRLTIQEPMPILRTRKLKLQQVFQNLISNAVKYNDKPVGLIEVGAVDAGNSVEFYVRDNGPGVSKSDQQSIFNLFQTASAAPTIAESSTGVGLNILKMLVEEQGGKIRIESELGQGATFFFTWSK